MQLIYAKPSPYSRKARVTVLEKGLADRVEEIVVSPLEDPAALLDANPLGKVPALRLDDGRCLYDSWVICEYLDSLAPTPRLIPDFPFERRHASGRGVFFGHFPSMNAAAKSQVLPPPRHVGDHNLMALLDATLDTALAWAWPELSNKPENSHGEYIQQHYSNDSAVS